MRSLESFFKNICVLMFCFVIRNSNVPEGRDQRHRAQKGAWIYDPLFGEWVTVQSANCSPSSLFSYLR